MKIKGVFLLLILFLIQSVFSSYAHAGIKENRYYRVSRVIDGDTFKLQNGQIVRLIGVDAPERKDNPKLRKDAKRRNISKKAEMSNGRISYLFTKNILEGKLVRIEFDRKRYDAYGRMLGYAYFKNGVMVNAELLKEGYAYLYTIKPDIKYSSLFQELYKKARDQQKGLWQKPKGKKKGVRWFK
jgi:micrococcal nuclease